MYSFGIIMDPIEDINPKEDSTFAIITALQKTHNIEYIIPDTIHLINQDVFAKTKKLKTFKGKRDFYKLSRSTLMNLSKLDCILFRKDPPVDEKYIQITHMLDYLEKNGVLIINSPQSLRDYNEKLLGNNLTKLNLPTLVSSNQETIVNFVEKYKKVVIKPLNLMGGKEISLLSLKDKDLLTSIKTMTNNSQKFVVIQKYLKQIKDGDTRILMTNGIVHENVLVRYPPKNDFRANLSYGGKFKVQKINHKHLSHLKDIAIYLKNNRIYFAGVDMIGDYITEINITSPTGIQQIELKDKNLSSSIANQFIKIVEQYYDDK
jgi:glutathione synthase